ncbi:MAG: hypothetical protein KGL12_06915 [Rhodospirillales bacterium]|nr:hypothetical protein [Rhodospirillales bacterium]
MRLGQPDTNAENTLSTSPTPGDATSSGNFNPGVLLYTQGQYQQVAPVVTSWSGDSLSAVKDGNTLVNASYTAPSAQFTYNFGIEAVFNTTIGNVSNFVTGNQLAYWVGNSASTGLGGLLWSNVGLTQNVFAGQIVNLINKNIDIQGVGEAKVQRDFEVLTGQTIDLLVNPAATVSAAAIAGAIRTGLVSLSAIGVAALAIASEMQTGISGDLTSDPETLRKNFKDSAKELVGATAAVFLLQAVVASAGRAVQAVAQSAKAAAAAKLSMGEIGVTIQAGPNSALMITADGVYIKGPEFATSVAAITHSTDEVQHWPFA